MVTALAEYEHTIAVEWARKVEKSSDAKLRLTLLTRDDSPDNLLLVNFSADLVCMLREAKYFLLLNLAVPASALAVYKRAEVFRTHAGNLELIVNMCNTIDTTLLSVERPLLKVCVATAAAVPAPPLSVIVELACMLACLLVCSLMRLSCFGATVDVAFRQSDLGKVDDALNAGLRTLTWKSHGIESYINDCMVVVRSAKESLQCLKQAMVDIRGMLTNWQSTPLFERTKAKPLSCDAYDAIIKASMQQHSIVISQDGRAMVRLLKEVNKKVKVRRGVCDGVSLCVCCVASLPCCVADVSLMCRCCAVGVSLVCRWCVVGVSLVCRWCVVGVLLLCRWCVVGVSLVCRWCVVSFGVCTVISLAPCDPR